MSVGVDELVISHFDDLNIMWKKVSTLERIDRLLVSWQRC